MQAFLLAILLFLLGACGAPGQPSPARAAAGAGGDALHQDADIFAAAHRLIGGAQSAVLVEMYEFGRRDLALALLEARRRGVDVRLVYDPSVAETARTASELAAAGLAARAYPLDDRRHQIDHVKLLVADGVALVGGMNWGTHSARNHDFALELYAPDDVGRLRAIFEQDWSLALGIPAPLRPPGPGARVLQTAPGADIRGAITGMLALARLEVEAEAFLVTDPDVEAALAAAHRRGARVRILLDPHQDGNPAARALLAAAGVEARFYQAPRGTKLHAKVLRVDDRLLVGSANWTLNGLGVNHELDVEVKDSALAGAFHRTFDADWARSS